MREKGREKEREEVYYKVLHRSILIDYPNCEEFVINNINIYL